MKRFAAIMLGMLMIAACSGDDPVVPTGGSAADLDEVLEAAGKVVPPEPARNDTTSTEEVRDGARYVTETHNAVEHLDNIVYLGLNDDVIWPGNIVRGDQAQDYTYVPISAPRAPITLSISLEGTGFSGSLSEQVANPSLSNVRQGISSLVGRILDQEVSVPAQVDWDYREVHSASQMSAFVGADVSYGAGSLSTAFNWAEQTSKTRIMAKYTQVYFSIDMDTPTSARAMFSADASKDDLARAMPPGSRPLYVGSVKYGVMALMAIESDYSASQTSKALYAAYNSGALDGEIEVGLTARQVFEKTTIRILVYGGSTSGIEELNGLDAFMNIIGQSTHLSRESPGVPLVYKFRHIHDNTLAMVSLSSQYTVQRKIYLQRLLRINSVLFRCLRTQDDAWCEDSLVDMDDFRVWVSAWNRADTEDPGTPIVLDDPTFGWHTTGWVEMNVQQEFAAVGATDLVFDNENYPWDFARLRIRITGRDWDECGSSEGAEGIHDLYGDQILGKQNETPGVHLVQMTCSDFDMECEIRVEELNK